MRVIKYPESLKNWKSTCVCERCYAELEFGVSDVWGVRAIYDGCQVWQYAVTCSLCAWRTYIDPVKHRLPDRAVAKIQSGPFLTR